MALAAHIVVHPAQHPPHFHGNGEQDTQSSWAEDRRLTIQQSLSISTPQNTKGSFFIPASILEKKDKHQQLHSPLLQLPTEILLLIIEKTGAPYFQISLGLTCKAVASIIFGNQHVLTQWRGYRDKEGLYRLLTKVPRPLTLKALNHPTCTVTTSQNPSLQHQTQSIQPYIPSTLRLCRACFRHVPKCPSYWSPRMSTETFDKPSTNWYDIFNFFEEGWRGCGQHRCPDCVVKGYLCFMNEATYKKALQDDEEDASWYGFGGMGIWEKESGKTSWRRVCPDLPARLKRA